MIKLNETLLEKIRADSFYGPLFARTKDVKSLVDAGFFDDELETDVVEALRNDTRFLTTPLHKIRDNLQEKPADGVYSVLVTTGAFSPLHKGHISMMEQARRVLEEQGEVVVGGLMAPGHDSYVSVKRNGMAAMSAGLRVELARMSLDDTIWLAVDPWPALYTPTELNFTTVLERTEKYLKRYLPKYMLRLWYVYGQDNQGFGEVFKDKPGAVCVGRNNKARATSARHVVFAHHRSEYADASSTRVRQGETNLLHANARAMFTKNTQNRSGRYGIRNDLGWATRGWNIKERKAFQADFLDELQELLRSAFRGELPIEVLELETQQAYLNQLLKTGSVLNLDICLDGGERLDVSRLFNVADLQTSSTKMINRPHSPDIDEQITHLSDKGYVYFDDDIVSGKTLRRVSELLRAKGITITNRASSLQANGYGVKGKNLYDIDDARDFLLGADSAGLTVALPDGTVGRAPYMAPYVSLSTRASIPPEETHTLSADLWALNVKVLKKYGPHICVKDADKASRDFLYYIGFTDSTPLYKVAEAHLEVFKSCVR